MCPLIYYILFFSFFADEQLDPSLVHVGYVVDKGVLGQKFLEYFRFPCQYHNISAPYTFIRPSAT